ncbi:MAG: GrpB family protein [Chloroflexota bacterium]|jgi:GrpB-like predicted nucleotidyltransferase (UPF0157 family)
MLNRPKIIGEYQLQRPELKPYDATAVLAADEIIGLILERLPYLVVEHIGSTAVPGMPGKGIIDLLLTYPAGMLDTACELLAELGFQDQPHNDPFPESRPMRVGSYEYDRKRYLVHVHVLSERSPEVYQLRAFRDRLRLDINFRAAYLDHKRSVLNKSNVDSSEYARLKGEFIRKAMSKP